MHAFYHKSEDVFFAKPYANTKTRTENLDLYFHKRQLYKLIV